ncbi:MAG: hypothetical protein ACT4QC_13820 [Planctomycetaceae bacterium]
MLLHPGFTIYQPLEKVCRAVPVLGAAGHWYINLWVTDADLRAGLERVK